MNIVKTEYLTDFVNLIYEKATYLFGYISFWRIFR